MKIVFYSQSLKNGILYPEKSLNYVRLMDLYDIAHEYEKRNLEPNIVINNNRALCEHSMYLDTSIINAE